MAKKSRRVHRNAQRPRLSAAQMVQPGLSGAAGEVAAPAGTPAGIPTQPGTSDLRAEYVYVISDLKRIGVIAAVMLALLIGLAILLT